MEDHGQLITHFESIFGEIIDHEVIKIILQVCNWNSDEAYEKLLNLTDGSCPPASSSELPKTNSDNSSSNSDESKVNLESSLSYSELCKMPSEDSVNGDSSTFNLSNMLISNKHTKVEPLSEINKLTNIIAQKVKVFIIMRGLPGSGKSTLARSLNSNGVVLSTDDYFYDKFNNYNYNPSILSEAHNWNRDRAKLKVFKGVTPIFIDNTNLELWEFIPYIKLALSEGYFVELLEPKTTWKYNCKELARRCKHNVPKKKIQEMKERFVTNLTIDEVLQKVNLKNNDIIERDLSSESKTLECLNFLDDPDIIIESSSDSPDGDDCSNENGEESSRIDDDDDDDDKTELSHEVFTDLVENFEKLLKKNLDKDSDNNSNDLQNKEKVEELVEDEAMYQFFLDYEDKIGKPLFPYKSKENNEDQGSLKNGDQVKSCTNSDDDNLVDWTCIETAGTESIKKVWDSKNNVDKEKEDLNLRNRSRPQRPRKRAVNSLVYVDEFGLPDQLEPDDEDVNSWVPLDAQKVSWDEKVNTDFVNTSREFSTGAIPKKLYKSELIKVSETNDSYKNFQSDKTTQYITSDYMSVSSESKIIEGNPDSFIPGPMPDENLNEPLTKSKLMLHKSSMTNDINVNAKLGTSSSLSKLIKFFPNIPVGDLNDMIEKCDYDLDWAMNILIDSGYKISGLSEDQLKENKNGPEENMVMNKPFQNGLNQHSIYQNNDDDKVLDIVDVINFESVTDETNETKLPSPGQQREKTKLPKSPSRSSSNLSTHSEIDSETGKEGAQYLTMEVDPMFASQLINIYGPISSLKIMSGFTKEDRKIVLPLEVCHTIYKYWSDTLEGKFEDELNVIDKFIRDDEELARKLQNEENSKGGSDDADVFHTDPPTSFREICDLEKALTFSSAEKKSPAESKTCSSMLTLQKLQQEFKHVDPVAIEEEYCTQSFDYKSTKILLEYKFGSSKTEPKTVLAPGISIVKDEEEEQDDDDDDDDDDEAEACDNFEIAVDDPQMFRDEAQMHYLQRKKALQKAQEASQKGMKSVASYYAQIGNVHLNKFKEANDRASKKIVNAVNLNKGPNTLDLHLLHVDEALREAQSFLSERSSVLNNRKLKMLELCIITGKGKHSIGGEARLKPAIRYFLSAEGYGFEECAGMFKVYLRSSSKSLS